MSDCDVLLYQAGADPHIEALRAGRKHVVLVSGPFDAAVLQASGEVDVVACMDPYNFAAQAETLARYGVRSPDPAGWGERGTVACMQSFYENGIHTSVAPVFPKNMAPTSLSARTEPRLGAGISSMRNTPSATKLAPS